MASYVYKKFTANDFATIPFTAHKQYNFSSASATENKVDFIHALWTSESVSQFSSASAPYGSDTINFIKYNQINHLFYKNWKRDLNNRLGEYNYKKQKRVLYDRLNIMSVPIGLTGHELRPNSLYISTSFGEFVEDTNGNLIISGTNLDNYITDIESTLLDIGPIKGFERYDLNTFEGYISFNGYENSVFYRDGKLNTNITPSYTTPNFGDEFDDSYYFNILNYKNVNFKSEDLPNFNKGINAAAPLSSHFPWPAIEFTNTNSSSLEIKHDHKFNFNANEDFTINFWCKVSASAGEIVHLIGKSTTKNVVPSPNEGKAGLYKTSTSGAAQLKDTFEGPQFPFEVYVDLASSQTPTLTFEITDTNNNSTKITSEVFPTSSTNMVNVSCIKSGSQLKLHHTTHSSYLTPLQGWFSTGSVQNIGTNNGIYQNKANLYIGNKGGHSNFLSGTLSNIRIINKALTDPQIHAIISGSCNGSPYVGNVFHKTGFITFTNPNFVIPESTLDDSLNTSGNTLEFQGSHLIYEHEYQCTIDEHEFMDTLNTSARKTRSDQDEDISDFATGSLFKPYVTTVGLYNEDRELLVVGKLGQPIRTSDETDTTIIVRWDT